MPLNENHPIHNLFYSVEDPQSPLDRGPAMTTLLYGVLGNDSTKFDEACRLIELFMMAAYEKGKADAEP